MVEGSLIESRKRDRKYGTQCLLMSYIGTDSLAHADRGRQQHWVEVFERWKWLAPVNEWDR